MMSLNSNKERIDRVIQATINIPYHLRAFINDKKQIQLSLSKTEPTVRTVLESLKDICPSLTSSLINENGDINPFVSIYVNDKNVKQLNYLDTKLESELNELSFRAAIAGG
jgi:molybdopterin converting factor small subunit